MNLFQKGEQNIHYSTCLYKVKSDYLLVQITRIILGINIKTTLRTAFQNITLGAYCRNLALRKTKPAINILHTLEIIICLH